jgi:crossover junction endodeoxyribonuclease RuvC
LAQPSEILNTLLEIMDAKDIDHYNQQKLINDSNSRRSFAGSSWINENYIYIMSIILGIDPGSRATGYGILHITGPQLKLIHYGLIRTQFSSDFPSRLYQLFHETQKIIEAYQPNEVSIEQIFTARNAASALKLGQARGAIIAAIAGSNLPITEYSAREVKLAVTGYGAAEKHQVQHMIKKLLKLADNPPLDASDALAIAICHAHSRKYSFRKTA